MNDPCSLPRFESVLRPPTLKRYHVQRRVSPLKNHLRLCSRLSPSQPHRLNATSNDEAVNKQLIFNPYEDLVRGKHFICTECGKCCTGAGEVWVNSEECSAIANKLGLSLQNFLSKYTKGYSKRPGWRLLKRAKGSEDCVFLVDGTKCSIYGARPLQCATYPWWPELMSPEAWRAEKETVCEGISHPESLEVDPKEKGEMLRLATEQLAKLQEAAAMQKKRSQHPLNDMRV